MRRLLCLSLLALAACVGPARTFDVYEGKAVSAAEAVRSAAETARVTAVAASTGKATGQYASVALHEAEIDAGGAQGAFESIQPPDRRSDRLREELGALLDETIGVLGDLRIAARRTQTGILASLAAELVELARRLDEFAEAHR